MSHPERVHELLASNPSYVFFTQNPDSNEGPRGSLNVPLTAGYSVAVDRSVIPLGSLLAVDLGGAEGLRRNDQLAAALRVYTVAAFDHTVAYAEIGRAHV